MHCTFVPTQNWPAGQLWHSALDSFHTVPIVPSMHLQSRYVELLAVLLVGGGHGVFRFRLQKKLGGHVSHMVSDVELQRDFAYIPSLHIEHTAHVRVSCCTPVQIDVNAINSIVFSIFLKHITVKIVFLSISFFGYGWASLKLARVEKKLVLIFWMWVTFNPSLNVLNKKNNIIKRAKFPSVLF